MSAIHSTDDLRSEVSQSELSEILNTTAFDTATHATAGDLPQVANTGDLIDIRGKTYILVDRTANLRPGCTPSWIWDHGRELRLLTGNNPQKRWQCTYCGKVVPVDSTTYHAGQHLVTSHGRAKPNSQSEEIDSPPQTIIQQVSDMAYKALVTNVQADRFRYLLIRWIVCMHVALRVVEHHTFRDLISYICPAVLPFFAKTGKTIRRWILEEFKKQRVRVKDELGLAKSMIHISFDLWTSPNSLGLIALVAHFLDKDLKNRSVLIGMRRVRGSHSGENIAESIIPILEEMGIVSNLGYFTTDNATNNDVAIEVVLRRLRPDIKNPKQRRMRCLGHILNLAAKAFLFGNEKASFEDVELDNSVPMTALEAEMVFWRTKGPLGKLHNLVVYIRKTPQRREAFQACCKSVKIEDDEFEGRRSPNFWCHVVYAKPFLGRALGHPR